MRDAGGGIIFAANASSMKVPVLDPAGFRWEEVDSVVPVGCIPVAHIRCHQATYAAGDEEGRYVLTHNPAKP